MRAFSSVVALYYCFLLALFSASCSTSKNAKADSRATISGESVEVVGGGAKQTPTKITTQRAKGVFSSDKGAEMFGENFRLDKDFFVVEKTTVETGVDYQPEKSPSPVEEGKDDINKWAYGAVALGIVVFGLAIYFKFPAVVVGSLCVIGAGVGVLALNALPPWVYALGGGGIVVAGTGFAVWWFIVRKKEVKQ